MKLMSSSNTMLISVHMGHRDQDGKKVDKMSLFFKVRSSYGQIKAKIDIIMSSYLSWEIGKTKIQVLGAI